MTHAVDKLLWPRREVTMDAETDTPRPEDFAMTARCQLTLALLCPLLVTSIARADVYRWDTGEAIPGTQGIDPGPGVDLSHMNLEHAGLYDLDLTGADFEASNLTNANLMGANLTSARLGDATLTDATLTGATVLGTQLWITTSRGFTQAQLASTASYQAKNLQRINLVANDLTGWDFSEQDLTGAHFGYGDWVTNLNDASFIEANLTDAMLQFCDLTNTNLTEAVVTGAWFRMTNLTKEQLYSTASYKEKNLEGLWLEFNDLTDWDFREQNLTDASFVGATLTGVILENSIVVGADFSDTEIAKEQLYSTAGYKAKDLRGVRLWGNDLSNWDFSGQSLIGATLSGSTITNADLTGADLRNANLGYAKDIQWAIVDSTTVYNQWTAFSSDINPASMGLTLSPSPLGDLNANDILDAGDFDILASRMRPNSFSFNRLWWLPDEAFDVKNDGAISQDDLRAWVKDLKHTWFGDANLDGEFNSSDFVEVFTAGKYEMGWLDGRLELTFIQNGASWSEGDWNGDGIFDSSDMVTAFADGGYEKGLRTGAAAVPEPTVAILLLGSLILIAANRRRFDP